MRTSLFFLFIGSVIFSSCTDSQAENEAVASAVVPLKTLEIPAFPERTAQLGDPAEAEQRRTTYATLQQKLTADPSDKKSWIKLTELYITEARITGNFGSNYDIALTILDDLLEKTQTTSPANDEIRGEALTLKALIKLSQHQFKEAQLLGEEAIKLDPYRAFNYGVLVDAHVELGNYAAAVQMSDRMVAIRPDLRSYSRVSYIRELHGDIPGAIAAMDMAVKAGYPGMEDTSWSRVILGRLFENKGDLNKAEEQYMAAITERQNYPPGMVAMGRLEMKKGNYDKAEKYLVDAIKLMPDAHAYMELARTYEAAGRNADRDQASARAEEILMGLAGAGESLAHSHGGDLHSHEDAMEHHGDVASIDHGHSHEVGLEMGRYELEFHKDLPTALFHANHEYGIRPNNIDVNALLASIHYASGDLDKADEHLKKALRTGSKDSQLMCLAGLIAIKKGDKVAGKKSIKEALTMDPYQHHPFVKEVKQVQVLIGTIMPSAMLRSYSLILLMSLAGCAMAQTHMLSGVVTAPDGSAIPGADVYLPTLQTGTTTDVLGRYKITGIPPGEHLVVFSLMGHERQEKRLMVDRDIVLDTRLESAPIELREVAIRSRSGAGSEVIQALDMRTRPVNTSQDLLTLVPGLFIAQHAGGGKAEQIFFRGFDIDHGTDLYITVDGMPVNMVSHAHGQGYADLHFTIPETMEKLVVHKGPYDARFGDFATSGTVEFKTRNSLDQNLLKVERGMFNATRVVGMFDILGKKHLFSQRNESVYVAGEYAYTDAYFQSKQHFGRFNVFGKYTGQLSVRTHLTLSGSTFGASWDASGQIPVRAVESGLIDRFGAIDDTEGGSTSRTNAYATLVTGLRNGSSFKNQIYFVKYDFNLYSNFTFFAEDSVRGDMIAQTDDRAIMGYTGTYGWTSTVFGKNVKFNSGVGLRHDRLDISLKNAVQRVVYDTIVAGSLEQVNLNAFIDATYPFTEKLSMNAAARLDVFSFNYCDAQGRDTLSGNVLQHRVSPKLSFTYAVNDRTQIYLRNGIGFHSNDARAVVLGQAARTLPRAYGSDLGTTFKPTDRMLVNLALWGLYLENELVYVGDAGVVETSDPTRRVGIDLSLRYQLTRELFADIDVNVVNARLIGPDAGEDRIPLAPEFTTVGGLTYLKERGFNVSLRYRCIADRPANEDNSIVAEGFLLLDAVLSYRFKALEIGASIENVMDAKWNQAQFATESRLMFESDPINELHYTPGTPRFLKGFVSYRF